MTAERHDAGLSSRAKALSFLRTGRVVVVHAVAIAGNMPYEATVRVLPAMEGQPDRTVLLYADGSLYCTCLPQVAQSSAAPQCSHVYATCLVTGRGGPR